MAGITGQLKIFARKDKGCKTSIELTDVVNRVLVLTSPILEKHQVSLEKEFPFGAKVIILGDALQLEQVLTNILYNAVDAMRNSREKRIRLSLSTDTYHVVLSCQDSGPGIDAGALEYLFDPFYTTKDIGEGLGLGLSISYGIINEMNGSIEAENSPEGGAVFTLRLPLAVQSEKNGDRNL
jgi:two-component system C4-dicarboxylate transport sensor histidine kinase DctB